MFIKITKSGKYEYVQIVRSKKVNGVTRHEVLINLGRKDEIENNPMYQRLANKLLELSGLHEAKKNIEDSSEATIRNWGYIVYKRLWDAFELTSCLEDIRKYDSKATFNLAQTTFLMVLQHLLEPMSKLGTFNHQDRYAKLPRLKLQHLYRSLDILSQSKEKIEDHIFALNYNLFNMKIDVVFYDVTTFAFESVNQDELRDFGYSKDNKYNEVQVVMGLLIDSDGFPIGYELFNGSTFDGKTMTQALNNLKKRFGIRRVVIVADRGLNSKINLKMIHDAGYGYIVASRIRKMSDRLQQQILDPKDYIEIQGPVEHKGEPEKLRYKILDHENFIRDEEGRVYKLDENLIITYSERRAEKDRADRERLIEKAKKLVEEPGKINAGIKRGGRKYLKKQNQEPENVHWILDEERIQLDEQFDGYYGIQTSEKNMKPEEILEAYHTLWKIEESFRIMKSTLEVRPIFHWTENRIKGHFVICFLAFLLERKLEYELNKAGIIDASSEKIREAINKLEFAEIELKGMKYYIKTKGTELSNKILKVMHIQPPKTVLAVEEFSG
jgi:transposase